MSRSYKKTPVIKDNGKGKKAEKRIANHSIRGQLKKGVSIKDGNSYKKYYDSWDVTDCYQRWTKEDAIKEYKDIVEYGNERFPGQRKYFMKKYPTLESYLNCWEKDMRRK